MVYGPVDHTWEGWEPKGPARRLTGEEVAWLVLGAADRQWYPPLVCNEDEPILLPADTLEDPKEAKWGAKL